MAIEIIGILAITENSFVDLRVIDLTIGIIAHISGPHIPVSNLVIIPVQMDYIIIVVIVDCISNLVNIVKERIIAIIIITTFVAPTVSFSKLPFSFYWIYFPFLNVNNRL